MNEGSLRPVTHSWARKLCVTCKSSPYVGLVHYSIALTNVGSLAAAPGIPLPLSCLTVPLVSARNRNDSVLGSLACPRYVVNTLRLVAHERVLLPLVA